MDDNKILELFFDVILVKKIYFDGNLIFNLSINNCQSWPLDLRKTINVYLSFKYVNKQFWLFYFLKIDKTHNSQGFSKITFC